MITTSIKTTEIGIVENHDDVRSGMAFIINASPGFRCSTYKTGEAALSNFKLAMPDAIIMDINLPGMSGIECTRRIRQLHPSALIMMCTAMEDTGRVFDALKAGASGYILKRTAGETLIESVKELLRGGAPMSSDIARKVVNSFREDQAGTIYSPLLTNKENRILDLLASGYVNKEIAERLCVSVNTVRTHIYHIYEKLHVHNRIEALNKIKKAIPQG